MGNVKFHETQFGNAPSGHTHSTGATPASPGAGRPPARQQLLQHEEYVPNLAHVHSDFLTIQTVVPDSKIAYLSNSAQALHPALRTATSSAEAPGWQPSQLLCRWDPPLDSRYGVLGPSPWYSTLICACKPSDWRAKLHRAQ